MRTLVARQVPVEDPSHRLTNVSCFCAWLTVLVELDMAAVGERSLSAYMGRTMVQPRTLRLIEFRLTMDTC